MKNVVIYVHGKGGNAEEANHYKQFFDDNFEIIGFDYKSLNPWDAKIEFINYFNSIIPQYNKIYLIANSIGAYFSLERVHTIDNQWQFDIMKACR